ncbi:hypothetical protein [Luteipulveratus mongoliensis]|nr:hypothetical protein [Luteipulveratus mongoliensis]
MTRLHSRRVSASALEQVAGEVDRLCTEYASHDNHVVLAEAEQWGQELVGLKEQLDLSGMKETLRLLGWLSLLRSCLLYDTGDELGANRARLHAVGIATDLGDMRMLAWGSEITAWIALTKGDLVQVVAAANAGVEMAPHSDVAAQLHAQTAKAYARMGDRHKTEVELEKVRRVLDRIAMPENLRNHFAVDPTKASFYAMDAYRVLGADSLASAMANHVVATSQTPSHVISPMRLAEAVLTKATVAARAGDVAGAVTLAERALGQDRHSVPSLRMVAQETAREMGRTDPRAAADFGHHIRTLS